MTSTRTPDHGETVVPDSLRTPSAEREHSSSTDTADELAALRIQVANLRAALVNRAEIGHAIGMIMLARRCDAESALAQLKTMSQNANIKVHLIATAMAEIVEGDASASHDGPAHTIGLRLLLTKDKESGESGESGTGT